MTPQQNVIPQHKCLCGKVMTSQAERDEHQKTCDKSKSHQASARAALQPIKSKLRV